MSPILSTFFHWHTYDENLPEFLKSTNIQYKYQVHVDVNQKSNQL